MCPYLLFDSACLEARAEILKKNVGFLVYYLKAPKGHFEINSPLNELWGPESSTYKKVLLIKNNQATLVTSNHPTNWR